MKIWRDQSGMMSMGIIELILAIGFSVFLLSWVLQPMRTSNASANLISYEMQQRQLTSAMAPLVEDIRESQLGSVPWPYLDTTNLALYNPINFPWFQVPTVSTSVSSGFNFVCYYFDPNVQTLWRVQTPTTPSNLVNCDPTILPAQINAVANNLVAPTAGQPIFRGDQVNQTVYFTFRMALGSGGPGGGTPSQLLVINRMATPRN